MAAFLGASTAHAASEIGKAVSVVPQVSRNAGAGVQTLGSGDGVVQNELIQTAASGNAKLRFIDATDLSIGPSSAVRLDRFVFNPNGTAKNFILDVSKGAFRFATGTSNHRAYEIRTPAAVIGVRGTRFSFQVSGRKMTLTVTSGSVIVCPVGLSRAACTIVGTGKTIAAQAGRPVVVISNSGPTRPRDDGVQPIAVPEPVPPPMPPILTMSGCHVGFSAGYARAQQGDAPIIPGDRNLRLSQRLGNVPTALSSRRSGATAGGSAGCDVQLANFVVGAETDLAYTDLDGSAQVTRGPARVTTSYRSTLATLGTTRVRFGLPLGPALFYGTGGLAYGNVATRASIVPPPTVAGPALAGSQSGIRTGWAVGGGVAYALAAHWSAKVEYLHYDLGTELLTAPTVSGRPRETAYVRSANRGNLIRTGIDYRF